MMESFQNIIIDTFYTLKLGLNSKEVVFGQKSTQDLD